VKMDYIACHPSKDRDYRGEPSEDALLLLFRFSAAGHSFRGADWENEWSRLRGAAWRMRGALHDPGELARQASLLADMAVRG